MRPAPNTGSFPGRAEVIGWPSSIRASTSAGLRSGRTVFISAARPATIGDAIEVPESTL